MIVSESLTPKTWTTLVSRRKIFSPLRDGKKVRLSRETGTEAINCNAGSLLPVASFKKRDETISFPASRHIKIQCIYEFARNVLEIRRDAAVAWLKLCESACTGMSCQAPGPMQRLTR